MILQNSRTSCFRLPRKRGSLRFLHLVEMTAAIEMTGAGVMIGAVEMTELGAMKGIRIHACTWDDDLCKRFIVKHCLRSNITH